MRQELTVVGCWYWSYATYTPSAVVTLPTRSLHTRSLVVVPVKSHSGIRASTVSCAGYKVHARHVVSYQCLPL